MKRLRIRHDTRYSFGAPVQLGPHTLLLRPREGHDLRIASSALDITPTATLTWRRDLFENVLGIAARFLSGYVDGPATEAGGAASHAWAEVYLPGAGWKGFDPTNASVVGPDHIPVAVHRHPEAVSPVAGTFTGPKNISQTLTVAVQINQRPEV